MSEYINNDNSHIGNMFASREGILQGCGGCSPAFNSGPTAAGNGKGIVQARGLPVNRKGGRRKGTRKRTRKRKRGGGRAGDRTAGQMARGSHSGVKSMLKRGRGGGKRKRKRKRRGGGVGYGMSVEAAKQAAKDHMGYGPTPEVQYRNCGETSPSKMGAGLPYDSIAALQKGAGKVLTTKVNNNLSNAGYGYKGGNVTPFAGSYAPVSSTSYEQTCQRAGRRSRKRGGDSRAQKVLDSLIAPFADVKEKAGDALRSIAQTSQVSKVIYPPQAGGKRRKRSRKRKRRTRRRGGRKKTRKRRSWRYGATRAGGRRRSRKRKSRSKRRKGRKYRSKQRGGYAQYHSNRPLTATESTPAGSAGGSWIGQLASPPTYTRLDNCQDNYNHYTGKSSPSPVLDGAAPPVPALGGN